MTNHADNSSLSDTTPSANFYSPASKNNINPNQTPKQQKANEKAKSSCPCAQKGNEEMQSKIAVAGAQRDKVLNNLNLTPNAITNLADAVKLYNMNPDIKDIMAKQKRDEDFKLSQNNHSLSTNQYFQEFSTYCKKMPSVKECSQYKATQLNELNDRLNIIKLKKDNLQNLNNIRIKDFRFQREAYYKMKELLSIINKEIAALEKKIYNITSNIQTDSRKNLYKKEDQVFLNNVKFILIYIYYEILLIYFFTSDFFKDQEYKNLLLVLFLILYLIIPFILKSIIIFVLNNYYLLLRKLNLYKPKITLLSNLNPDNIYPNN